MSDSNEVLPSGTLIVFRSVLNAEWVFLLIIN